MCVCVCVCVCVSQMVQAFTHATATVEPEKGGRFRLLDGNVLGEFTELVRPLLSMLRTGGEERQLDEGNVH